MRQTFTALLVTIAVISAPIVGGLAVAPVASAQEAPYNVDVVFPENFQTGENQTIGIEVDNTGSDSGLFNPIVEVPISGLNLSTNASDTAFVKIDGAKETRRAEVNTSQITSGDSLFIYGEEVPAGESRTYYFNISIDSPGNHSVTAEVRPLYNENDVSMRTTESAYAKGEASLSVTVEKGDAEYDAAEVEVNDSKVGSGSISTTLLEGPRSISISNVSGIAYTEEVIELEPHESRNLEFKIYDSLSTPATLYESGSISIDTATVGQTVQPGNATVPQRAEVSYFISASGGEAVVGQPNPDAIGPFNDLSVSISDGKTSVVKADGSDGVAKYRVTATQNTRITTTFTGYPLGDADLDDGVDRSDAQFIASHLAAGNHSLPQYGDVDNDGSISPVDAMYIAQYTEDNRTASYTEGGS